MNAELKMNKNRIQLRKRSKWTQMKNDIFLYILLLPTIAVILFFSYLPMPGLLMAFMDYDIIKGFKSDWVGFANIVEIFKNPDMYGAIWNTLKLNILGLIICHPIPIIFALLLNEVKNSVFKRTIQTISYLPHFLSWISVIGIAFAIYAVYGPVNDFRLWLMGQPLTAGDRIMFLADPKLFIPNVLGLGLWKEMGWSSIIYLAALTAIDPQLYEASYMDGANKFKQAVHITIPGIMPTVIMLLILRMGNMLRSNFELIYGLQNPFVNFEVISTIIYKYGINGGRFSQATAFGFVDGMIAFLLVFVTNKISKKISEISIW